ncbi:MAG: LamG domain-containing protein [Pseudomonadales bacterium]|nr:LamG domain-containing protein [Pseudomonadales bacterium]
MARDGSVFVGGTLTSADNFEPLSFTPSELKFSPRGGVRGSNTCTDASVRTYITMTVESPSGITESDSMCLGGNSHCEAGAGSGVLTSGQYFTFNNPLLMQELSNISELSGDWKISYNLELQAYAYATVLFQPDASEFPEEYVTVNCSSTLTIPTTQNFIISSDSDEEQFSGTITGQNDSINFSVSGSGQARKQVWAYVYGPGVPPLQIGKYYNTILNQSQQNYSYELNLKGLATPSVGFVAKTSDSNMWLNDLVAMDWQQQSELSNGNTPQIPFDPSSINGLSTGWAFDEGAGNLLSSEFGNTPLTLHDGSWTEGKKGSAIQLTGSPDQYTGIGSSAVATTPIVDTSGSFSVSAWVKLDTYYGGTWRTIASQDGQNTSGFWLAYSPSVTIYTSDQPTKFRFIMSTHDEPDINSSSASLNIATSSTKPELGKWYHVVGVRDKAANEMRLYVNGQLEDITSYSGGWASNGPFRVGKGKYTGSTTNWSDWFPGAIDDMKVFTSALSDQQVYSLYRGTTSNSAASHSVNELTLNSLQTLYTHVATGTTPLIQGPAPKAAGSTPLAGPQAFQERLNSISYHGALISAFAPESGSTLTEFLSYKEYLVGDLLTRPAGALAPIVGYDKRQTFPTGLDVPTHIETGEPLQQTLYSAQYNQEWYAAAPTDSVRVLWSTTNDVTVQSPPLEGRAIRIRWPTVAEGLQEYLYGDPSTHDHIPDVKLNPSDATDVFQGLLWSENLLGEATTNNPVVNNNGLSGEETLATTNNGYTSLLFHEELNPDTSPPRIQAIRSRLWSERTSNESAVVGQEIIPPNDAMTGKTGYPMRPLSKHDANPLVFDATTRQGQIVPVNLDRNPNLVEDDDIRVAWYEEDTTHRDWPFRTVTYELSWDTDEQIVIASELCSSGVKPNGNPQIPLAGPEGNFSNIQLYVQNDPQQPGFNPNEEHALIEQLNSQYVACALRADLGVQNRGACDYNPQSPEPACYTSDPYVIVKAINPAIDTTTNNTHVIQPWVYRVFKSTVFDSTHYPQFNLSSGEAGSELQPPFPLNKTGFASPNTMGAGTPFWVDVHGQVWARSAGNLTAQYYYPATAGPGDFYIDNNADGINDATSVGDIPWLAGFDNPATPNDEGTNGQPLPLNYNIAWPSVVPEIEIGDTLTDARANGLPPVRNMNYVDVIFDENDPWDLALEGSQSSPTRHQDASLRVFDFSTPIGQPPCVSNAYIEGTFCDEPVFTNSGDSVILGTNNNAILPAQLFVDTGQWYFPSLPSHLRYRLFFDPTRGTQDSAGNVSGEFIFRGGDFDGETGRPYVQGAGSKLTLINIMSASERETLKLLDNDDGFKDGFDDNPNSHWDAVVDALYFKTRNPARLDVDGNNVPDEAILAGFELDEQAGNIETQHKQGQGELALTTAFADQEGYITIAENNSLDSNDPVAVHVMKIIEPRARGALRVLRNADNKLDQRLVVRHDLDFSGRDGMTFEWWWRPDNGAGVPTVNLTNACAEPGPGTDGCPTATDGWQLLGQSNDNSFTLEAGQEILSDGWMLARYKGLPTINDPEGDEWVGYAGQWGVPQSQTSPVATAGWVKRVLEGINAFEQNSDDLYQNEPVTYSSLLVQAGRPYIANVALNSDPENLKNIGLLELYQTVLNRAQDLSIDANDPIVDETAVNKQLLLAANRLAELSMILGDEAYSDAQDPTVGTAELNGSTAYLSPSQFAFQNQVPTLLDEELALLRGKSFNNGITAPYPLHNRLPWNFSAGSGEPVYVQVYGITDQEDPLGATDDAQRLFPQGHGDALGYYLDATKQYYRLAMHPNYDWNPLTETTSIAGVAIEVDYADEQNFARAAARKARTHARILDLTYRQNYTHDPAGQWTGYSDTDPSRRWGVDGWARRGAQSTYLDYALANALLKSEDTENTGLQRVDRITVTEIDEIASGFDEIEGLMSLSDTGRNPLGLSADAVPFDISPTDLAAGETHFDQVYRRAVKASVNALQVFNYANDLTQAIRTGQLNQGDLQAQVDAREQEYKHRLIELFGYPYAGDKGPNATYPSDYTGADLYHFMYLDATTIDADDAQGLLPPTKINTLLFKPNFSPEEYLSSSIDVEGARIDFIPNDVLNDVSGSGYERWFDVNPDAVIDIPYPFATAGDYAYTAPASWGKRQAPGEIQLALLDMVRLQARLKAAMARHQATTDEALAKIELLEARFNVASHAVEVRNSIFNTYATLQSALITMRQLKEAFNQSGEMIYRIKADLSDCSGSDSLVIGFSTSLPNVAKCVQKASSAAFIAARLAKSTYLSLGQIPVEIGASLTSFSGSLTFQNLSVPAEAAVMLKDIETELRKELEIRYQVAEIGQELEIAAGKYESLVAQGLRVMEERVTFRRNIARITTDERYQDFVYRVFRNDALQKYRASFDLATRYTYLAAKAFDYETGLLSDDPSNGQFLDSILKQRSLGQFTVSTSNIGNSTPLSNVEGLSDPLAKMKQAYDALAANFDNVYDQNVRFSLRQEMLRIPGTKYTNGSEYDDVWQQALIDALVPNLWEIPEFSQYAAPPRPESAGPLPGLVLRFSTEINDGKNLFGLPLGGGDSAYSTTYSATKFRRLGVDLKGYDGNSLLSATPYVYLLPVGIDVLRSPTQIDRMRQYAVVEQAIPVPVDLVNGGGYEQAGWIPQNDAISIADSWDATRKHPQLQAGWGASSGELQPLGSTRLVGRSVWNTEWMLIIPGNALLADEQEGLRRLIRGDGNGNGITDIELFFESFSVQ